MIPMSDYDLSNPPPLRNEFVRPKELNQEAMSREKENEGNN